MPVTSEPSPGDIENAENPPRDGRAPPPAVVAVKLHEDDVEREHFSKPKCQDAPWACLFVSQCAVIVILAVGRGIPEIRLAASTLSDPDGNLADDEWNDEIDVSNSNEPEKGRPHLLAVVLLLGAAGLAGVASLVLFEHALRKPESVIRFGLFGTIALCVVVFLVCVASGSVVGALLWLLFGCLAACFVRSVQNRIPFAAANLGCSVAAIKRYKATVWVALQASAYQVVWFIVWAFAVLGFALHNIRASQAAMPDPSSAYSSFERDALGLPPPHEQQFGPRGNKHSQSSSSGDEGSEDDLWGYYGLGQGCRSVLVTLEDASQGFHMRESVWLLGSGSGAPGTDLSSPSSWDDLQQQQQQQQQQQPDDGSGRAASVVASTGRHLLRLGARTAHLGLNRAMHKPSGSGDPVVSAGGGANEEEEDVGLFCVCSDGALITPLQCSASDFLRTDLFHHVFVYILFLLSLFWVAKVVAGLVHVTSAGVVAAWWFGPVAYATDDDDSSPQAQSSAPYAYREVAAGEEGETQGGGVPEATPRPGGGGGDGFTHEGSALKRGERGSFKESGGSSGLGVVRGALNRALGPSFGSICLGSLIVALLSTIETVVRFCKNSCAESAGNGDTEAGLCYVCLCCLTLILDMLHDIMEYFNRWAFTYVAVYGDPFVAAGRSTFALFQRRGWSSVVADTLCSLALSLASLFIALLLTCAAAVAAWVLLPSSAVGPVAVTTFLSAYLTCECVMSVLNAGVLTVIVCFAENPFAGAASHPEEFASLVDSWRLSYGPELEAAGYDRLF